MSFLLSPELEQLQQTLRGFFSGARAPRDLEREKASWKKFCELGALYGGVSEERGGLGLGFLSNVIAVREAGRTLSPLPILETILFGVLPAQKLSNAEGLLGKLIAGDEIATGVIKLELVPEPRLATVLISLTDALTGSGDTLAGVSATHAIVLPHSPPAELVRELVPFKNLARTGSFELGTISPEDLRILKLEQYLLLSAEMSGAARAVEEMTHLHVTTRKQFGVPIGSFQAIQHKLADCRVALDAGDSLIHFAGWCRDNDPSQFEQTALGAYSFVGTEAKRVVEKCLQAHGGIAFTYEYDLHLFLRRILSLESWFDSPKKIARELAEASL